MAKKNKPRSIHAALVGKPPKPNTSRWVRNTQGGKRLPMAMSQSLKAGFFDVVDPGPSGTFDIAGKGQGYCAVEVGGGNETRTLPSPQTYGVGTELTVVLRATGGGSLTVQGSQDGDLVLTDAGAVGTFLISKSGQNHVWATVFGEVVDLSSLESDISDLQTDVGTLQSDVTTLQSDVAALQSATANSTRSVNIPAIDWRIALSLGEFLPDSTPTGQTDELQMIATIVNQPPVLQFFIGSEENEQEGRLLWAIPENYVSGTDLTIKITVLEVDAAEEAAFLNMFVVKGTGTSPPGSNRATGGSEEILGANDTVFSWIIDGTGLTAGDLLDMKIIVESFSSSEIGTYHLRDIRIDYTGHI